MQGFAALTGRLKGLAGWRRFALACALGLVSALALPPIDLWPLLFLTIPAIWMLAGSQPGGWRSAFSLGWWFGLGYFLFALHWIGFAFLVDAEDFLWMMPFAVLGLVAFMAFYWGLAFAAVRLVNGRGLSGFLWLCASLGAAEMLRGRLLTGFPWGAPGLAADGMGPVAQLAALFGMEGLTPLVLVWAGAWPFALLRSLARGQRAGAVLLLFALPAAALFGQLRLSQADADGSGVTVRLVQPNIPQSDKWRGDNMAGIFDELIALSSGAPQGGQIPDAIIWPESAVPYLLDESPESLSRIGEMLGRDRLLITGSVRRLAERPAGATEDTVFNSVMAIDGEGRIVALYDKWKLVPGGEFLPFEALLSSLGFRKVVTLPGSFGAGQGPRTLALPHLPPAGFSICYEAIFPAGLVGPGQRPRWLVNVTNDGWFGTSTGPHTHLAQARMRSIEQGLPMARAANTGISAVIDGYGRELSRLGLGQEGAVDTQLPQALPPTAFARFGAVGALLLLAFLTGLGLQWRERPRPPLHLQL
jgi:apolipoprotein N-acyltransferase